MMKSEYERSYQWNPHEIEYYARKNKEKQKFSEPFMTHKRRVKLPEDNVMIGVPLTSQNNTNISEDPYFVLGNKNKKFDSSIPYRNIKALQRERHFNKKNAKYDTETVMKYSKNKSETDKPQNRKPKKYVNEAIQTENGIITKYNKLNEKSEKSTQINIKVPELHEKKTTNDQTVIADSKYRTYLNNSINEKSREFGKTDYQTKFAWAEPAVQKPSKESDKNCNHLSKFDTKLKIYSNFISEYQRQYRPYDFVAENRLKRMKPLMKGSFEDSQIQVIPEKPEIRRRAVTPPPSMKFKEQTYPPQNTVNPQRFNFPHGKQKRFLTEYSANFDNKWKKVESMIQKTMEQEEALKSNQQSKWFKEILDLRKKAQEYRQRARGTHFSREHLGEIFTKSEEKDLKDYFNDISGPRCRQHRNRDSETHEARNQERNQKFQNQHHKKISHGSNIKNRNNCNQSPSLANESILTPISVYSSSNSTIVGRRSRSNSRSPEPKHCNWQNQSAGKPSYDNNLLLDEIASHDTELKDGCNYQSIKPNDYSQNCNVGYNRTYNVNPDKNYTFQRYFNEQNMGDSKNMKTVDYDAVSSNSITSKMSSLKSVISSSSRSIALETLERAKKNRDHVLRSKT